MKKLSMCIILSLLMCLVLAFPAFAAVYAPARDAVVRSSFDALYSAIRSKAPANYSYYMLMFDSAGASTTNSGNNIYNLYLFDTQIIDVGTNYYYKPSNNTNIFGPYKVTEVSKVSGYNSIKFASTSFMGYFSNFSTARYPDYILPSITWEYEVYTALPPIDITALQTLITTAKAKTNTGYSSPTWQALQTAITDADNLLKTTGYTQAQVDSAKNTLQDALDGLWLLPDISALQSLIATAKAETDTGYSSPTWQALQTAITAADNLLKTTGYTQAQVDSEKNKLQAALDGLVLIPVLPDTTELETLVDEADAIEDIGYTVPTWTRFDNARTDAHVLLARPVYTELEVTATTTELRVSINGLTLSSIVPLPDKPFSTNGYDVGTGDVLGFFMPAVDIFVGYVVSVRYVIIGVFTIIFTIKLLPNTMNRIVKGLRRR